MRPRPMVDPEDLAPAQGPVRPSPSGYCHPSLGGRSLSIWVDLAPPSGGLSPSLSGAACAIRGTIPQPQRKTARLRRSAASRQQTVGTAEASLDFGLTRGQAPGPVPLRGWPRSGTGLTLPPPAAAAHRCPLLHSRRRGGLLDGRGWRESQGAGLRSTAVSGRTFAACSMSSVAAVFFLCAVFLAALWPWVFLLCLNPSTAGNAAPRQGGFEAHTAVGSARARKGRKAKAKTGRRRRVIAQPAEGTGPLAGRGGGRDGSVLGPASKRGGRWCVD